MDDHIYMDDPGGHVVPKNREVEQRQLKQDHGYDHKDGIKPDQKCFGKRKITLNVTQGMSGSQRECPATNVEILVCEKRGSGQ